MSIYDVKIEPLPTPKKTLTEQWRKKITKSVEKKLKSGE